MHIPRLAFSLVLIASPLQAADVWPQFRGPEGNGHAGDPGLPLSWSDRENVAWKVPVHDRGWSSPVIWNEQIWLTTATADGRRTFAVCLDRSSGKTLHDVHVFDTAKPEPIAAINSYASPTPVIEEGRLYVHYGTYGTACLDTASGKILWTRRDLRCDHHEGPGGSPILWRDLLIFHVDGRDVQYVVALDKQSGKTVWKTPRSIDYNRYPINLRKAFCTPIVIQSGGRPVLFSPGAKAVMGYDPATGEELWKLRYNGWSMTPRPVTGHGLVFFINDYERPELLAVRPDGRGELGADAIAWKITRSMPNRPSPLLVGDLLYVISSDGIASAIEAQSGRTVWKERLEGDYSASPIYADGRIYACNQQAVTTVLAPGRQFRRLAENVLDGETMMASPAIAGRALFLRTRTHLYRIEQRP